MAKKNWLFGLICAMATLISSASFALESPVLMPVTGFDVVAVTIDPTDTLVSVNTLSRPNNDGIFDIGTGSSVIIAYIGDRRVAMATSDTAARPKSICMATCNHKTTDNVTAHTERPFEVGWR